MLLRYEPISAGRRILAAEFNSVNNGPRGSAQSAMAKGRDKADVEAGDRKEAVDPIMKKPKFKDDLKAGYLGGSCNDSFLRCMWPCYWSPWQL